MKAMILKKICNLNKNPNPLELTEMPVPVPNEKEILIKVAACGVCHTEIDEIEGRTPPPRLPVILGHQVVGRVEDKGDKAKAFKKGDKVGVAWIYSACGKCKFCLSGNENLCKDFKATGRDANGGYAEYMKISEDFAYSVPSGFNEFYAAPLLCAGAVGYRALRLTGLCKEQTLGLTGFGASGHLVLKLVKHLYRKTKVFVFVRNPKESAFALELGADWSGDFSEKPPEAPDCIIDTTPAWKPVVEALKHLKSGGRLVINAIRKEKTDKNYLLKLDYSTHLWMEKEIKSVANVSRKDINDFLSIAAKIKIKPEIKEFPLEEANRALTELKNKKVIGAKVLRI
jgi:propanol-preferring alcohol dehydrogenase